MQDSKENRDESKPIMTADAAIAIQKLQNEIVKNSEVKFSGTKYKYMDLSALLKALAEHKIIAMHRDLRSTGSNISFTTDFYQTSKGGALHFIYSDSIVIARQITKDESMQDVGSAITYSRRYHILSCLGLFPANEDRDEADKAYKAKMGDKADKQGVTITQVTRQPLITYADGV